VLERFFGKELNAGSCLRDKKEARTVCGNFNILMIFIIIKSYERVDASTATVRVRQNYIVVIIIIINIRREFDEQFSRDVEIHFETNRSHCCR